MSTIPPPKSIDIAQVILNASIFNFRRARVMEDRLLQAVVDFFELLEVRGIDYLLVGGVALLNYVEGRNTEDVDLILSVADMNALDELTVLEQDRDLGRARFRDLRVDLLWTQNPLFDYVKRHCATTLDFRGRDIACSTVEGLLLLKFYALPHLYREANFDKVALYETDIAMLLQRYPIDVEAIFTELEKHLHEGDIQSLRTIHREIEDRIRRFTNGL
jgi:hypothetical protein